MSVTAEVAPTDNKKVSRLGQNRARPREPIHGLLMRLT
jgi:hypothetical protein